MVARLRIGGFILSLSAMMCFAQSDTPVSAQSDPNAELVRHSAEITAHPEQYAGSGWVEHSEQAAKSVLADPKQVAGINEMKAEAGETVRRALSDTSKQLGLPDFTGKANPTVPVIHYRLFLSQSLGKKGIRDAFAIASGRPDMEIVFNGLAKGQKIQDFVKFLQDTVEESRKQGLAPANINIDPPKFTTSNVTVAPTLQRVNDKGVVVASVRGVLDTTWIDAQIDRGRVGDLGQEGEVFPVLEENLLDRMKTLVGNFDFGTWKENAKREYWTKAPLMALPHVRVGAIRRVDPTFEVTDDIVTPAGEFLAHRGDRVNPLKVIGFKEILVAFDATDPAQLKYVQKFTAAHPNDKIILVTTNVERERGWDGYAEVENTLSRPMYVLAPELASAFKIERVPSVVTAKGDVFEVAEVDVAHLDKETTKETGNVAAHKKGR